MRCAKTVLRNPLQPAHLQSLLTAEPLVQGGAGGIQHAAPPLLHPVRVCRQQQARRFVGYALSSK